LGYNSMVSIKQITLLSLLFSMNSSQLSCVLLTTCCWETQTHLRITLMLGMTMNMLPFGDVIVCFIMPNESYCDSLCFPHFRNVYNVYSTLCIKFMSVSLCSLSILYNSRICHFDTCCSLQQVCGWFKYWGIFFK